MKKNSREFSRNENLAGLWCTTPNNNNNRNNNDYGDKNNKNDWVKVIEPNTIYELMK